MHTGLSEIEAQKRLSSHGFNELPTSKSKNIIKIVLEVIKEPMFILLMACGSLYFILGDYSEGTILISWVLIIILMTFYQHQKTEKALESLRDLSSPRAMVIRDGEEKRIPGREVVPDDLVILNEGDRIPADGILIDCLNLTVDESILTGESIPINKTSHSDTEEDKRTSSGTLIVQGRGIMQVTHTGLDTKFGKIGQSLMKIEGSETKLQKEIRDLIKRLLIIGIVLSAIVTAAFFLTRGNFINSLLSGLATAMAMLPEEFPVVLTVFLALGAWRLSKKNVLTRKPVAIETLGSATVLCSDKTGTITQNKMSVQSLINADKTSSIAPFEKRESTVVLLQIAGLASQVNSIDPMEKAILSTYTELTGELEFKHELIREYDLSRSFFALTRVVDFESSEFNVFSKGAPEAILSLCDLDESEKEEYLRLVQEHAGKGERLLGLAKGKVSLDQLPEDQSTFKLQFVGFIGFADPIRPEVPAAIEECYQAGIRVIMITGDYPSTALSIAGKAGIQTNDNVLTGSDLHDMNDEELAEKIRETNIFARIIPEQKLRIINALKANNEIVAMTGDGVNDAPALMAADIGISMGAKGTDVARESSSLVLMDDNFASIVNAVRSGRRIYDNMEKAMSFIIAVHIPIIGLALVPALFPSIPVLLMPVHIVFLELIIDPVCTLAFESEKEEKGIMNRPPRDPSKKFFGLNKIGLSALYGIILLAMVLGVYFLSINEGHSDNEIRSIAFSSLIIGNFFLIITSLSKSRNFLATFFEKNLVLYLILFLASSILALVLFVPYFQNIFKFENPGFAHYSFALGGALIYLIVMEIFKQILKRKIGK
ncbi:MAG: cation-translocating P-type ATPase [Crocinitomicaceae bacterium]|nr:cation-translocating P-type ATPase [Crocinitomicaceae bacterium]